MPVVNLAGVPLAGEPLPEGRYEATVTSAKSGVTNEKKEPKVILEFTVSEGDLEGRKVWRTLTFGEKALPFYKTAMVRLGVDPDDLEGPVNTDELNEQITGAQCRIAVSVRKDDSGRISNDVTILGDEDGWSN